MSFSRQPAVAAKLRTYLEKNHLPHALLFSGPPEAGQIEVASELAKIIFCANLKNGQSCGECPHCSQVDSGTHPDFFILAPEEGHVLKVEPIRELIAKASFKPFQAPAKVFVIDHADRMNDVAQNALLKTLEEPQGRTHFILISYATEKLLPTIRSRSQTLYFTPLVADTSPDPAVQSARHELLRFLCGESDWKTAETASLEREEVTQTLSLVVKDLRDILVLSAGAEEILGLIEDKPLKERALNRFSAEDLTDKIELLSEFREKIVASANVKLALSVLRDEMAAQENLK